jgi:lysophospholipase L1-like esterase
MMRYLLRGFVGFVLAFILLQMFAYLQQPDYANYPPRGTVIVAFGDSLTEGVGGNGKGYPEIVAERIGLPIINAGISGDTTESALSRLERDVLSRNPDIVLVALGGNDALQKKSKEQTFANLRTIIDRIQKNGSVTILIGIRGRALSDPYNEHFEKLAKDTRSIYIPDMLDGIFGDGRYMSDAVHPNARGYEKIADRITPVLQSVLSDVIPKEATR